MEFDIRYDRQSDQFLLFISRDDTYGLTGRIVAKRRSVNHDWQVFKGMNLVYQDYLKAELSC